MESTRYRFEVLADDHEVSRFSSATTFIDSFLKNHALTQTKIDRTRTYVLVDSEADHADKVIGFFTLHAHCLYYQNELAVHPVVEIDYLARHIRLRGQGLGDKLLTQAFRYIVQASKFIAIEGVSLSETEEGKYTI